MLCKFLSLIASILPQSSIYAYLKFAFFMLNFAKSVMPVYEHWDAPGVQCKRELCLISCSQMSLTLAFDNLTCL